MFSGNSGTAMLCCLEEILTISHCSYSFAGMCHSLGKVDGVELEMSSGGMVGNWSSYFVAGDFSFFLGGVFFFFFYFSHTRKTVVGSDIQRALWGWMLGQKA